MALNKKRLGELKRFCLRYDDWKEAIERIDFCPSRSVTVHDSEIQNGDPIFDRVDEIAYLTDRMHKVENCAKLATGKYSAILLLAVTKGLDYDDLKDVLDSMGCSKEHYRKIYDRFFRILDGAMEENKNDCRN